MSSRKNMKNDLLNMKLSDLKKVSQHFGQSVTKQTGGYLNKKQIVHNLLGGTKSIHKSKILKKNASKTWHIMSIDTEDQMNILKQYITLGGGSQLYKICTDSIVGDCSRPVYLTGRYKVQEPIQPNSPIELEIRFKNLTRSPLLGGPSRWARPDQLIWRSR